jgi:ABC-type bacteriocin/lantibiotic exporter with double-glycine peptidase domain
MIGGKGRTAMAMDSSIYHPVPVMIQPQSWACWYTSFQMVVRYAKGRPGGGRLRDPADVEETRRMYQANQGIGAGPDVAGVQERERIARLLGFAALHASLTEEGLWELLRANPAIYAGRWPGQPSGHFVVITGISLDTIAVNNPAVGAQTFNYRNFVNTYLLQTAERPLIHVP